MRYPTLFSRKNLLFLLMLVWDAALVNLSLFLSFYLRFEGEIPVQYSSRYAGTWIQTTAICLLCFVIFRLYDRMWRFASVGELLSVVLAAFAGTLGTLAYTFMAGAPYPRSVYLIFWLCLTAVIGLSRFFFRVRNTLLDNYHYIRNGKKRVLVIGAGSAGSLVIKEFKQNPSLDIVPVGFIDDDRSKHGLSIHGVKVLGGRERIPRIAEAKRAEEIIIAMPSADRQEIRKITDICRLTGLPVRIVPGIYELVDGRVDVRRIRNIKIEDLLGREPVQMDVQSASDYIAGKTVLVTGAGGSIGSELVKQLARLKPDKLLLFDISENNIFELEYWLKNEFPEQAYVPIIGSVRDAGRVHEVFAGYRPQVVFHAAAHKHVPLMELNPAEAVKNNVMGTLNVAQAAGKYRAERFILVSTDKAVNPSNVMGATKRAAELIVQLLAQDSQTRYAVVRFGNVLGSAGSVIPLFKKQIESGGPVTVTHPEATRYFMTIPEAAQLVIQAGAMARGGEIFVLDMGKPVKISDLARDMIRLSGFEPDKDIRIEYTGLRPGEKLHEELFYSQEDVIATGFKKIYIARTTNSPADFKLEVERLFNTFMPFANDVKSLLTELPAGADFARLTVRGHKFAVLP